jgi:hypothetical protein
MDGAIEVEIVKAVSQSYLASLWAHETFQKDRDGGVQTLTNRFGRRFTLAVLLVSLGTATFWLASGDPRTALRAFIAVLIVACPCALALAAPFTFGTAQRWLGRTGVFLRNTLVLERLARVDTVVFDKTGTLTTGGPDAVTFHSWDSSPSVASVLSEEKACWVASLARHSTHPHATRLCEVLAGSYPVSPAEATHEPHGRAGCPQPAAPRRGEDTAPCPPAVEWDQARALSSRSLTIARLVAASLTANRMARGPSCVPIAAASRRKSPRSRQRAMSVEASGPCSGR